MNKLVRVVTLMTLLLTQAQCSDNLFLPIKEDTDASRLFEAKKLMNKRKWDDAIEVFNEMSSDFLAKRSTKVEFAKAYAGLCGLDFLQLMTDLTNSPSTAVFGLFLSAYAGSSVTDFNACVNAEAKIQEISTDASVRTGEENLVMAFISFAKMGTILAARSDPDGNGTANWGNSDSCTTGTGSNDFLTSTEAKHVATGFANALASLTYAGGSFGGDVQTDLQDVCTTLAALPPPYDTYNFCNAFVIGTVTSDMEKGIRSVIQEGQDGLGLGTCTAVPNSIDNCACP